MPTPLPPRHARQPRREVRFTLYLTPAELATLRERAAATRARATSACIREAALGRALAAIPAVNQEAYAALARLSANLNQLARHLNVGNVATADRGRQLGAQLAETAELVRRLRLDLATAR